MRTYYRGPDAVVTERYFAWRRPEAQIFAVDDLDDVWLVRGPGTRFGAVIALWLGLLGLAIVAALRFDPYVVAPVAVVLGGLAAVGLLRRGTPARQIRATYRSHEVTLYSSADPRVFNQVTRALRRALEQRAVREAYGVIGDGPATPERRLSPRIK